MFRLLILLACCSLITPAIGGELEVHMASKHFDDNFDYNETNLGLGYSHDIFDSVQLTGGGFNNSYDTTSIYAGAKWLPLDFNVFRAGVVVGVVTGYEDHTDAKSVQPMILPEIQIGTDKIFLISRILPDLGDNSTAVVTFSLGIGF
jgi:hypothetical protein